MTPNQGRFSVDVLTKRAVLRELAIAYYVEDIACLKAAQLARRLDLPARTVGHCPRELKQDGKVKQYSRNGPNAAWFPAEGEER